ncbi:MAG: hypothetical protein Q7J04_04680 [Microcella sp.]|nr:hypothetical protein [Microcella sp.]
MRWDHLFDDLAGQLEHELQSEESDLQLEEERLRLGRLALRDRLAVLKASSDAELGQVRVRLRTGELHSVRLVTVGRDWVAGDLEGLPGNPQAIIPLAAIESVLMTAQQTTVSLDPLAATSELAARLGIAFLLRDLCRRRSTVTLVTASASTSGTIDRVGRDHLDLAVHDPDRPRRTTEVEHIRLVGFDQLLLVRL